MNFRACAALLLLASVLTVEGRRVEITVLHTTDLHGNILPTRDYDGNENVGGLLRCASLIEEIRAQREHVLVVDCGDLYQGSAVGYLTGGRVMTRALEWLKYDAWILGNHEFDWGIDKLIALHDQTTLPMVAANIGARPSRAHPLPRLKPFVVKNVDGVRIAIVGLITPGVPSWSRPDLLGDALFEGSVEALKRVMPTVRAADPDILLVATHQGYRPFGDDHANEINAIARAFPEIDVIIGGHSHRVVERARVGKTLYTQAGYYGIWLGRLDLVYDTVLRQLIGKEAHVLTVADRYPLHAGLRQELKSDLAKEEKYLNEKVGTTAELIPSALDKTGRSPVQMLICRAMAEASGADVVLHGVLSEDPLPKGEIRMADVWRIVPYENRIGTVMLTPAEITELLEENGRRRDSIQFMGAFGLTYDWLKNVEGKDRVQGLKLADGSTPHPRKRLKVALNSYVLASGGARFPRLREIAERPESRLEMLPMDTRTAVVRYIRRNSPLTVSSLMGSEP